MQRIQLKHNGPGLLIYGNHKIINLSCFKLLKKKKHVKLRNSSIIPSKEIKFME